MKIVFSFFGGSLDGSLYCSDPAQRTPNGEAAVVHYHNSKNGRLGFRFAVSHSGRDETYEVVKRFENGNSVVIRAHHLVHDWLDEVQARG